VTARGRRSIGRRVGALAAFSAGALLVAPARASAPVSASSPVGVGCLIEKVVLTPPDKPDTAQIWGACAIARSAELFAPFGSPARGYLYYFLPAGRTEVVRTEWRDLQQLAGKAEGAAFGDRTQSVPRLRPASEAPRDPDEYVVSIGVQKLGPGVFLDSLRRALNSGRSSR